MHEEVDKENSSDAYENVDDKSSSNLHVKLHRLGKLYAGPENLESMSSPVHQRTETLSRYKLDDKEVARSVPNSSARSARLAALAKSIEEWEDDLTNLTPASNKFIPQSTKSPLRSQGVTSFRGQLMSATQNKASVHSPSKAIVNSSSSASTVSSPSRLVVSSPSKPVYSSPAKSSISSPAGKTTQPTNALPSPRGVQMGSRVLQGSKSPVRVTSFVKKQTKTVVWDRAVIATLVC